MVGSAGVCEGVIKRVYKCVLCLVYQGKKMGILWTREKRGTELTEVTHYTYTQLHAPEHGKCWWTWAGEKSLKYWVEVLFCFLWLSLVMLSTLYQWPWPLLPSGLAWSILMPYFWLEFSSHVQHLLLLRMALYVLLVLYMHVTSEKSWRWLYGFGLLWWLTTAVGLIVLGLPRTVLYPGPNQKTVCSFV